MNRLPIAAFLACAAIWGSTFLVIRIGNGNLPALWACTLRLLLASFLLNGVLLVTKRKWPEGEALKAAIWFGFFEFGLSMGLLYYAERLITSGLAALVFATCPITSMILGSFLGTERFHGRQMAVSLFALVGVTVIFWREILAGSPPIGMACALLAAVAASAAGIMLQRGPKQSAVGVNAVGCIVGAACTFVASLAFGEKPQVPNQWSQIYPVAYLAVLGSCCAFVMFAWLLNHWTTSKAAFVGVVVPVIAVILGALVLKESISPATIFGGAMVILSVVLALRVQSHEAAPIRVEA